MSFIHLLLPMNATLPLIAAFILVPRLHAQQGGAKTMHEINRETFARQAAACFGIKPARVEADPPVETDEPYAALRAGGLRAFRATEKTSGKTLVKGFAGLEEGAAFIGWDAGKIGLIGGERAELEPLLKACHVLEPRKRANAPAMAARLLWCLGESKHGVTGQLYDAKLAEATGWAAMKDAEPRWLRPKTGATLRFCAMTQGRTGSWDYHQITVHIAPDYQIRVSREEVRP